MPDRERNVVLAATLTQFISLDDHGALRVNANDSPWSDAFGQVDGDGAGPAANIQQLLSWLERVKKVTGGVRCISPAVTLQNRLMVSVRIPVHWLHSCYISAMDVPASHADLLSRPLFAHLATVRPDGAPVVNPMWFLWDGARAVIKLTHTKRRSNYKFFQSEPRVAIAITDPDDPYRYLQIRGVVEAIEDDPTGAFYQVLQLRYRGAVSEVRDRAFRVIVTIRPTGFKVR